MFNVIWACVPSLPILQAVFWVLSSLDDVGKPPFEPSLPAQYAGIAALDDYNFLDKTIKMNNIGINYLTNKFDALEINYIPSYTNFITTIWKDSEEAKFISNNLLKKGIIVRRLSSFGWENSIRISIGTEKENTQFIDALKSFL